MAFLFLKWNNPGLFLSDILKRLSNYINFTEIF
ncbi:hypothetical protein GFO_2249 [Christiangramia forsetii KT0803]|uniref:Uncharacterized protein n=1 Tax=Christiangramia forsetii (strain DSM 17595 / CGMCC 1.15422 / KT0803) TaxID=411154 RepID=A0M3L9_CHRFK|nr:hypothetical protein GFO_2249 [Christiangramia forsetii KT0803]